MGSILLNLGQVTRATPKLVPPLQVATQNQGGLRTSTYLACLNPSERRVFCDTRALYIRAAFSHRHSRHVPKAQQIWGRKK
ncbi:hypothetical protein TNCV_1245781 [Trichonephila clavipes]|uniref:Uncharacterized protein n=1 Tax=Trichonephila clavipes TaxID=2585209 RepID=A0A8X6R9Z5_TRICX|nr:hypothetical protein TNCV_1245781 [Trichonephila clavipes]